MKKSASDDTSSLVESVGKVLEMASDLAEDKKETLLQSLENVTDLQSLMTVMKENLEDQDVREIIMKAITIVPPQKIMSIMTKFMLENMKL